MERNDLNNQNTQEIDLVYLSRKIRESVRSFNLFLFRFFRFLFRKKIILLGLIVSGTIIGFMMDKFSPVSYKSEIVVAPNFHSTDYLYSKIDLLNGEPKKKGVYKGNLSSIKVQEVEDIYDLLESNNLEVIKIITEGGKSLENLSEEKKFAKNYRYHLITLKTKNKENTNKIINTLLNDLNSSPYFLERGKYELQNIKLRKEQITKSIDQINEILNKLGSGNGIESNSNLNINTYDQLNAIIDLKDFYTKEIIKLDTKIIESNKIIYPLSTYVNNEDNSFLKGKWILLTPAVFVLLFLLYAYFVRFYNKYKSIDSHSNA